jgi:hypothetical protein
VKLNVRHGSIAGAEDQYLVAGEVDQPEQVKDEDDAKCVVNAAKAAPQIVVVVDINEIEVGHDSNEAA